jgi:hypothetical protein
MVPAARLNNINNSCNVANTLPSQAEEEEERKEDATVTTTPTLLHWVQVFVEHMQDDNEDDDEDDYDRDGTNPSPAHHHHHRLRLWWPCRLYPDYADMYHYADDRLREDNQSDKNDDDDVLSWHHPSYKNMISQRIVDNMIQGKQYRIARLLGRPLRDCVEVIESPKILLSSGQGQTAIVNAASTAAAGIAPGNYHHHPISLFNHQSLNCIEFHMLTQEEWESQLQPHHEVWETMYSSRKKQATAGNHHNEKDIANCGRRRLYHSFMNALDVARHELTMPKTRNIPDENDAPFSKLGRRYWQSYLLHQHRPSEENKVVQPNRLLVEEEEVERMPKQHQQHQDIRDPTESTVVVATQEQDDMAKDDSAAIVEGQDRKMSPEELKAYRNKPRHDDNDNDEDEENAMIPPPSQATTLHSSSDTVVTEESDDCTNKMSSPSSSRGNLVETENQPDLVVEPTDSFDDICHKLQVDLGWEVIIFNGETIWMKPGKDPTRNPNCCVRGRDYFDTTGLYDYVQTKYGWNPPTGSLKTTKKGHQITPSTMSSSPSSSSSSTSNSKTHARKKSSSSVTPSPLKKKRQFQSVEEEKFYTFSKLMPKLCKRLYWGYRGGVLGGWTYVMPGHRGEKQGGQYKVDYFKQEDEVVEYCMKNDYFNRREELGLNG